MRPEIVHLWHPTKNGRMTPADYQWTTDQRLWWRCPNGPDHEWQARPHTSTGRVTCPFCINKRASKANNLEVARPDVAATWHPKKNRAVTPRMVVPGSNKPYWWQCDKGHEWSESVIKRCVRKMCPDCRVIRRATLLLTEGPLANRPRKHMKPIPGLPLTPELVARQAVLEKQWHPSKNGAATPSRITPDSRRRVWWQCPAAMSHVWRASPLTRFQQPECPHCMRVRVGRMKNLAAAAPEIVKQWHPTKNGGLDPADINPMTIKMVWWKCDLGPDHEWQARVYSRVIDSQGCPYCRGRRKSVTNTLDARMPELAKEWHPDKNGKMTPSDVSPGANVRVWWRCSKDPTHEWKTHVRSRARGQQCPYCTSHKHLPATSLGGLHPEIVPQWHPTKNPTLTPFEIGPRSQVKVWWKCPAGPDHEWECTPERRVSQEGKVRACPFCANWRLSVTNSLAARAPNIIHEWDKDRNGDVTPDQVVATVQLKKYWWRCPAGHVYDAAPYTRAILGRDCRFCKGAPGPRPRKVRMREKLLFPADYK